MTGIATIRDAEQERIGGRRELLRDSGAQALDKDDPRRIGLALSGGGIRSATFSLGVLQSLSAGGHLAAIDYLSTVSGGSYAGSFFGALFIEPERRGGAPLDKDERDRFLANPLGSPRGIRAVANLREFGRYLTPGGASDVVFGASLLARNWLLVQLVLGLLPLTLFLLLRGVLVIAPELPVLSRSGTLTLLAISALIWIVGLGNAFGYWFTRKEKVPASRWLRALGMPLLLTLAGIGAGIYYLTRDPVDLTASWAFILVLSIAVAAVLVYAIAQIGYGKPMPPREGQELPDPSDPGHDYAIRQAEDRVRARLTRWLARTNGLLLAILAVAAVNLLGEAMADALRNWEQGWNAVSAEYDKAYLWSTLWEFCAQFWPLLLVVLPFSITVWGHRALKHGSGPGWLARPSGQTMLGVSILIMWLAVWTMVASLIVRGTVIPWLGHVALGEGIALDLVALLYGLIGIVALGGLCFMYGFANMSSLVTFYAARLKKAYVGASNPREDRGFDVNNPGDLVPMETYFAWEVPRDTSGKPVGDVPGNLEAARPLHLINATIAQTVPEGKSNVVAYDRKGKPLHVAPAGIVAGHGAERVELRPHGECESLALSDWTSISGAAASTALGGMSSLGLSVLAMLTNVRLGYWWKAERVGGWPLPKSWRDTMIGYLVSEFTMNFDVSLERQRRWYLTDGGHFDNTGAYALLQRQVDFIIVSDNGADPDYACDDMVRLVQLARTDLGAEIDFCSKTELDRLLGAEGPLREAIGEYREIARKPVEPQGDAVPKGPCAALARITYRRPLPGQPAGQPATGWLLHLKPRLNFAEPPELLAYRRRAAGANFPQQTTLDQFFDEEQWEAYRRLGEVVGTRLFGQDGWLPDVIRDATRPTAQGKAQ